MKGQNQGYLARQWQSCEYNLTFCPVDTEKWTPESRQPLPVLYAALTCLVYSRACQAMCARTVPDFTLSQMVPLPLAIALLLVWESEDRSSSSSISLCDELTQAACIGFLGCLSILGGRGQLYSAESCRHKGPAPLAL